MSENNPKNKTCFVIMGFGTKMDYLNSKKVNLDQIYQKVIRKVFEKYYPDYAVVRSDDILISQMIDAEMYAMIMKADLVIAVISTLNANAIYELGIRHAYKPFSTIIIMQDSESEKKIIPFDINHIRILTYKDYSEKLGKEDAKKIRGQLHNLIEGTLLPGSETARTDSPVFAALPAEHRPENIEENYRRVMLSLHNKEKSVRMLLDEAEMLMNKDQFQEAEARWKELHAILPKDPYIVHQLTLSQYKPEKDIKEDDQAIRALYQALHTLKELDPQTSLDLETLGLAGAIYKRLYLRKQDFADLDKAITYYHKGYLIQNDYYNGENYAYCLLEKTQQQGLSDEACSSLKYLAMTTFHEIIHMLDQIFAQTPEEEIDFWMYATYSVSCYCIGDPDGYERCRRLFLCQKKADWQEQTYTAQLEHLKKLL